MYYDVVLVSEICFLMFLVVDPTAVSCVRSAEKHNCRHVADSENSTSVLEFRNLLDTIVNWFSGCQTFDWPEKALK